GDAADRAGVGRSSLAAPLLEGLPGPPVLWTVRPPAWCDLAVVSPARPLDAAALAAARRAADERIAAACAQMAAGVEGVERERLEALAALRRADRGPVDEEAWRGAGAAGGAAVVVEVTADEPLAVRVAPAADGSVPPRALATTALVVAGLLTWTASAGGRAARRSS
ncbi:MAG: hypothetical protein ACKOZU_09440, partial [Planctomycetaceae bacterium]